jgi:hypothetical protein
MFGIVKRLLKSGCVFAMAAFLAAVCGCGDGTNHGAKDAQIERAIIGTWGMVTNRCEGIITFHSDRTFSSYWSNMVAPRGWRSEGEWKVVDGDIVSVITNKSAWNYTLHGPTGTVDLMKILRLSDQEFIAACDEQTNKWTRRK